MRIATSLGFRIIVPMAIGGMLAWVNAADKPNRKESQAAYQRGLKADAADRRDEAIAAYSEAIQNDPSDADPYRARGKDYLETGERAKAAADLEEALKLAPADG